jgi:hypothetical protein
VWNDTLFLSRNNVMDYSLLVGIADRPVDPSPLGGDGDRPGGGGAEGARGSHALPHRALGLCGNGGGGGGGGVLVVGVIDYARQYTVDKLAETVVKTLYDPTHQPTVIEPANYKRRFREAMDRYFMALPSKY